MFVNLDVQEREDDEQMTENESDDAMFEDDGPPRSAGAASADWR